MTSKLTKSEQTALALQSLYEGYGYRKFAMRKFEEYSLYLENKNFLTSEYILTFNDPGGKLMALKPDVTLSILKNSKDSERTQKTYYRENVYRLDTRSMQYREIAQVGLEVINVSGAVIEAEICELAGKTLSEVDNDYILCISDMEFVSSVIEDILHADAEDKARIVSFIKSKNAHELREVIDLLGCEPSFAEDFCSLIMFTGDNEEILARAEKLACTPRMKKAVQSLRKISALCSDVSKIRVDLSLLNDGAYYSGLVFCGYVKRIPRAILSGGFYGKMAEKFGCKQGAIGFALILGEIDTYYEEKPEYDVDTVIVYSDGTDCRLLLEKANEYRAKGFSVRIEKSLPEHLCFKEVIYM